MNPCEFLITIRESFLSGGLSQLEAIKMVKLHTRSSIREAKERVDGWLADKADEYRAVLLQRITTASPSQLYAMVGSAYLWQMCNKA